MNTSDTVLGVDSPSKHTASKMAIEMDSEKELTEDGIKTNPACVSNCIDRNQ